MRLRDVVVTVLGRMFLGRVYVFTVRELRFIKRKAAIFDLLGNLAASWVDCARDLYYSSRFSSPNRLTYSVNFLNTRSLRIGSSQWHRYLNRFRGPFPAINYLWISLPRWCLISSSVWVGEVFCPKSLHYHLIRKQRHETSTVRK